MINICGNDLIGKTVKFSSHPSSKNYFYEIIAEGIVVEYLPTCGLYFVKDFMCAEANKNKLIKCRLCDIKEIIERK